MGGGTRVVGALGAAGAALVLAGMGPGGPLGRVASVVPPPYREHLLVAGLGLLGVVLVLVTFVVAVKAWSFLLHLAFRGGDAISELPDVDPVVSGAVAVTVIGAGVVGGTTLLGTGAGGADLPYVEDALSGGETSPSGIVSADELSGVSTTGEELPDYADADGDRIPDDWERAGETPAGVPLPGADPQRMDLYLQVNYAEGSEPLTDAEKRQLRTVWAEMPVRNPDGTTGIRVHIVDESPRGGAVQAPATVGAAGPDEELLRTFYSERHLGDRRCLYYQAVFGDVDGSVAGWGFTPGYFAVVDGDLEGTQGNVSARVAVLTHELLHNLVGQTDRGAHVQRGWLADHDGQFEPALSDPARRELAGGFERSPAFEQGLCDAPVGAAGNATAG